jgi:CO/xanthine dehydrogenase Mo-binding subunit
MDLLAEALDMDPVELRLKNILEPGKATITGQVLEHSVGARAALEAVRDRFATSPMPVARPGHRIGVGFACAYKNVGYGGGGKDSAGARLELLPDGALLVRHGAMDMGQGCDTVMAQIAAQTLGIPLDRVRVHAGDTAWDPDGGQTTASRQTFVTGNAVHKAALKLQHQLCAAVAEEHGLSGQEITLSGGIFRRADDGEGVDTLGGLANRAARGNSEFTAEHVYTAPATHPIPQSIPANPSKEGAAPPLQYAYCFGAQAAIVAVDEETHEIEVLEVIAAQDVGQAINPQSIIGQMEGALLMGLGYALSEEFPVTEGRPMTDRLGKLGLLRMDQLPGLQTIIVTDPHPEGPFGAKGMSELPISPTAPAVANAVARAVGARVRSLPLTKDKIATALQR